jgi:polyphosphate kinase
LIVRGACALRPGVRGVSSRIRLRSVVGRFLEHSRIFAFSNGGAPEVYLGSADWMPRNLYERVEVMFRLKDPALCQQVCTTVLAPYFADTVKTRFLLPDGTYERAYKMRSSASANHVAHFSVQEFLIGVAEGREEHGRQNYLSHFLANHPSPIVDLLTTKWETTGADETAEPAPKSAAHTAGTA